MALLFAIVGAWAAADDGQAAEIMQEAGAIDAQIAPGVVDRADEPEERHPHEARIRALIPDAARNCLRIDDRPKNPAQAGLAAAVDQIRKSEIGAWLVQMATARDVTVCLDRATQLEAHYRSHLGLLGLSTRLDPAGRVVFLAHELAHVPQHPRFSNNRRFSPEDMLLLQRVREAAAEAVATRVLWQLRADGMEAPWQVKLTTAYRDIAEDFAATMAGGEGIARELWATRSAFLRWFAADWRLAIYDDLMLRTLVRIANDPIGLIPTSRHLSDRYLRGIADYADQGFLIGGDGQALISGFQSEGLSAGGRSRLDEILAQADDAKPGTFSSIVDTSLSAVSPDRSRRAAGEPLGAGRPPTHR
ncbi:MAG: DUF6782 family putative metallopeptidase [Geminicoccaceae bacterium]